MTSNRKATVFRRTRRSDGKFGSWVALVRGSILGETATHFRVRHFGKGWHLEDYDSDEWYAKNANCIRCEATA